MKKILTLSFLIFSCFGIKAQLVSYELIQTYDTADLNQVINNFGAGGLLIPEYSVDLYRVYYRTEYNDSTTLVSGALAVPRNALCTPALNMYMHGTSSNKNNTPSYNGQEKNICLIFAALGQVVCAPDYIGLGASTEIIHPYMHGFSQAHSGINMLRATRELQDSLNFELSNQLFIFGYSQGGYATAATVKYIEEYYSNEFKVTAAAPMSGPYNLAGVQTDFINSGLPYATPGYLPYIVLGYQSVYHDLYNDISEILVPPYDSIMPYYLYGHNYGIGFINNQCTPIPSDMFTTQAEDAFNNDPNFVFRQRLNENDLLNWTPQTKMRMYYCTGDEQVYFRNAVVADSVWNLQGAPDVQAVYLTNDNHGGCVDKALIAGKIFLDGLNNHGIEIIVNYNASNNSYTVSVLNDDIANYIIEWNTNETSATINNINANSNYTVTLTKVATGCSNSKTFNVASVTGVKSAISKNNLMVYPNPTSNYLTLETTEKNYTLKIFDAVGNKVLDFNHNFKTNGVVNVSSLPKGVYHIVVEGVEYNTVSFVKE